MVAKKSDIIMKDICTSLDMPKSTLTNMVNRLERKGYLNRTISRRDLRSYGLALRARGTDRTSKDYKKIINGVSRYYEK